jgi:hypothetical protein
MADSNLAQLAYRVESVYNESFSAAHTMKLLRYTSESLSYDITNTSSQEIRSDRATADLIQTGAATSGGFNFELSATTFDDFLVGAMYSAGWSTQVAAATQSVTFSASASTLSITSTTNVTDGQWIQVKGLQSATSVDYFRVMDVASPTSLVVFSTLTLPYTGTQCTVTGSVIRNGITEKSFGFEKKIAVNTTTATNVFFQYMGMIVNQMSLSAKSDAVLTGSFDFMGASASVSDTTIIPATSLTAATVTQVLNATSNVGGVFEGKPTFTAIEGCLIQGIDINLNNNLRQIKGIGRKEACDVGVGECSVSGSLTAYFFSKAMYQKYLEGTETAIAFRVSDANHNGYIFTLPRLKIETDKTNIGGSNQDIMENMTYRALYDSFSNCQIQIDKF